MLKNLFKIYSPIVFNLICTFFDRVVLKLRHKIINEHKAKVVRSRRIELEEDCLRWTPLVVSGMAIMEEEKEVKREVCDNFLTVNPFFVCFKQKIQIAEPS